MRRLSLSIIILLSLTNLAFTSRSQSNPPGFTFENDEASIDFPYSVTFKARITAPSEIEDIILEYSTDSITCGKVTAKGFPDFIPSASVGAWWTWNMQQSGSLPPGAKIHWRWRVTTTDGQEAVSPEQTITWLDSAHSWESITDDSVNLYWYSGGKSFGTELHDAALKALETIRKEIGLTATRSIDVYIYATNEDFQDSILYEPGWTGGQAIPQYGIVLIGIAPEELEWGKSTIAHEIAHILQGQSSFTCLGQTPSWLVEGIAMYAEGGLTDYSRSIFKTAVQKDTLLSVRSLSGSFSESPDAADLSYSQSYSLVNFLITQYGKQKLSDLMSLLSQGYTIDDALLATYSFDIDGFEVAWRKSIGAKALVAENISATPTTVPTPIPTIIPLGNETFEFEDTPIPPPATPQPPVERSPIVSGMMVGFGIFLLFLIIVAIVLILKRRSENVQP